MSDCTMHGTDLSVYCWKLALLCYYTYDKAPLFAEDCYFSYRLYTALLNLALRSSASPGVLRRLRK